MCMRFNISEYSVTARSVVAFFMAAMLLGGIYAFEKLGKREDSTFVIKSAIVICPYSGATPEEVENLVSKPLERGLRSLSGIHKITSESHYGYARLVIELHPSTPAEQIPQRYKYSRRINITTNGGVHYGPRRKCLSRCAIVKRLLTKRSE